MRKFLMLVATMLCILCGALAFAACGETNGLGDVVVKSVQVDERGHLTVTYSDGTVKDLGEFEPSAQTGTEGLQFQKRKDEAGNEYAAVVGLGTVWETDIVIPSVYRGLPVKEIGESAFNASNDARNASITSVVIPDSVTEIGERAFWYCSGLAEITIPDSVTEIGEGAFRYCSGLAEITIPDSVTSIGGSAFSGTAYYEDKDHWTEDVLYIGNHLIEASTTIFGSYSIRNGTKTIAGSAFYRCEALTEITIPDSVITIGDNAFSGCNSLKEITIPDSVTTIRVGAFWGCSGLTEIKVDSGNQNYCMQGDCLIEIKSKTLIRGCNRSQIPDDGSVTSIGVGAFSGCSELRNVYFENPNGWTAEGTPISGLEDSKMMAEYLREAYYNQYSWERKD